VSPATPTPEGGARPADPPRPAGPPARVACVHLPHVAVAVEARDDDRLVGRPFVVVPEAPSPATVQDLSYPAHLAGLVRGMPLAHARRACPEVVVVAARPALYRQALQGLLEALAAFTDAVEPAGLEHSWLAAAGLAPRPGQETTLADEVARATGRALGLPVRVGLAHGKLTSRILTRYLAERDTMVLPPGREVAFLGGLTTRYLPLAPPTLQRLLALGLAKVHQYAALPGAGILPRFGYEGLRAWRLAHGQDDPHVRPWRAEAPVAAHHAFPEPIANVRSLEHHVGRLVDQVARPLAARFQMTCQLVVRLDLATGAVVERRRALIEPTSAAGVLRAHALALLAGERWAAPVARVEVAAHGLCPTTGRQLGLFRAACEAQAGAEAALDDLRRRYGADVVLRGRVLDPDAPLPERRATLERWA